MKEVEQIYAILNDYRMRDEIRYAILKHPEFTLDYPLAVLLEEVGEVARAINENDEVNMADELRHVITVCARWLNVLDDMEDKKCRQ